MSWRLQPVYREFPGLAGPGGEAPEVERVYSMCEIYLDDKGALTGWSSEAETPALGTSYMGLLWTLGMMIGEAVKWEPVKYDDLKPGMVFKRADQRPDPTPDPKKEGA